MAENRYLIAVGINDYEIQPLDFCDKDVNDIVHCMIEYCNVKDVNVIEITSTKKKPNGDVWGSFLKSIERIKSTFIQHQDSVFFYFSGHGVKSDKSTAIVTHKEVIQLQEVFNLLAELKPKFIFCLIDSCYSGVGIEDGIAKSSTEFLFEQHLKVGGGYNIICASAQDATAKEDSNAKNGRLTWLFMETIKNKLNYKNGVLSLSKVFQLIDDTFKENPQFKQSPFSQTKGLSTYPIAFLPDVEIAPYFAAHYIDNIEDYDWNNFKNELSEYSSISGELINEFTRLVREILRNSQKWGGATFLKVEIGGSNVSLYDNSGTYFDIFQPKEGVKARGGVTTAKIFMEHFGKLFSYSHEINGKEIIQIFSFKNNSEPQDRCVWRLNDIFELWRFQRGTEFVIPEGCDDYRILIPHGGIDLSTTYAFMEAMIKASISTGKSIIINIDNRDRLKEEFIRQLKYLEKSLGKHYVVIE